MHAASAHLALGDGGVVDVLRAVARPLTLLVDSEESGEASLSASRVAMAALASPRRGSY